MNVSIEDKKKEAIARMKKIGIFEETIRQFEEDNKISISFPPMGTFYWVSGENLKAIRKFEEEYNCVVYTVIRTNTTIGLMDSYLYVSDHPEEWEMDNNMLLENEAIAYVENYDAPDCSEFGAVGFALAPAKGLVRIF